MKLNMYDFAKKGMIKELLGLVEQGENINIPNEFGFTPLHYAISKENKEMALMLLENGADGRIKDNDGFTPLSYTVDYNLYDVAKVILEKTPEAINITDKYGNQPLWYAVDEADGNYRLVELFLKYNADIHHKNNVDKSPLDITKNPINDEKLEKLLKTKS